MSSNDNDTIAILFQRDPLKYTEGDIKRIIEAMREARRLFKHGGKTQTAVKRDVSLDDLGL